MRLFRLLALSAGVVVMALRIEIPAEAGTKGSSIRYAGLDGCVCAPWKLWARGGQVIELTDARVFSADKQPAPLALSPDGGHVAYFQRRSGALLVREMSTGEVHQVPGVRWSRKLRAARLDLAPAGRYVVLSNGQDNQVLDMYSGESASVPPGLRPWSFSPDARFLLAVDGSFRAGIYSTSPWAETGRVPVGGALGPGGVIVAHLTARDSAIGLWNVPAGRSARDEPIALPSRKTPTRLRWDDAGRLELQMIAPRWTRGRTGTLYTWYRVNPETGHTRRINRFTVPSTVHSPVIPGLTP